MKFCSNCGKENVDYNNFCSACGNKLDTSTSNEANVDNKPFASQSTTQNNSIYAILGWISAVISILFIPILFGGLGVIFGYLHKKTDKTHGTIIMIASIVLGLFGFVLGMAMQAVYYY